MTEKPSFDLVDRAGIELLVNAFYQKVRSDEVLGFIFDEVARIDWPTHLPRMYAFWETVLFRSGGYSGNPLTMHARLAGQTAMGRMQFDRWLTLFCQTVDELFAGENADHLKNIATDMAGVIHSRIHQQPPGEASTARYS